MKITYCFHLLLFAFLVVSCSGNKNAYTLKGNISGLKSPVISIVSDTGLSLDTIQVRSGKFTYNGVSPTVEPLVIYMENKNTWITVWVQNGENIQLKGNALYPELMIVKGGEINKLLSEFKIENKALLKERCDLRDNLSARTEQATELGAGMNNAQLSSQLKNIDQILKTKAQDFVKAHPSSVAALVMIQDYLLDVEHASQIQPFLDLLTDEVKKNPLYGKLHILSMRDIQTKAGQPALDFKIKDEKNDTISLDTFKDKYLLLTFATSQCELCKPGYGKLLDIKDSFPSKDVAILTISLDENKEEWKKVAKENGVNWTQAIDTTGWDSEIATRYNVLSIPCNYLIDKNKTIIGSKLHVDSIHTILSEKLKPKKLSDK